MDLIWLITDMDYVGSQGCWSPSQHLEPNARKHSGLCFLKSFLTNYVRKLYDDAYSHSLLWANECLQFKSSFLDWGRNQSTQRKSTPAWSKRANFSQISLLAQHLFEPVTFSLWENSATHWACNMLLLSLRWVEDSMTVVYSASNIVTH